MIGNDFSKQTVIVRAGLGLGADKMKECFNDEFLALGRLARIEAMVSTIIERLMEAVEAFGEGPGAADSLGDVLGLGAGAEKEHEGR